MFDVPLLIAPLAAFLIGLCAVPTVRRIALAVGFVDNPDQRRKLHECADPARRRYRGLVGDLVRLGHQPARFLAPRARGAAGRGLVPRGPGARVTS